MYKIRDIENDHVYNVTEAPQWVGGVWECGDQRIVDLGGQFEPVIEVSIPQSADPLAAIYLLEQMGLGSAYKTYRDAPERTLLEQETLLRAKVWERNNPILLAAATAMGITSEQLDQMFIQIGY